VVRIQGIGKGKEKNGSIEKKERYREEMNRKGRSRIRNKRYVGRIKGREVGEGDRGKG
jgi:hypothetical protein